MELVAHSIESLTILLRFIGACSWAASFHECLWKKWTKCKLL